MQRDGRNVNCNRWGGNEENKITQRMKTGNRCPAMCAFAVKSVAWAVEGEIEISHRQLYPGVDVQKSPLPSSHTLLLEYNHREVRIYSWSGIKRNDYAMIKTLLWFSMNLMMSHCPPSQYSHFHYLEGPLESTVISKQLKHMLKHKNHWFYPSQTFCCVTGHSYLNSPSRWCLFSEVKMAHSL